MNFMTTQKYNTNTPNQKSVSLTMANGIDEARGVDGRVLIDHLPALFKADLILKTSRDAAKERNFKQNTKKVSP